ncbi:ribonuclease T2-like protein [Lipomyces arxii]|uniref:ribonuclease T2-like protein n=1 Tax=Lipomyces arxii TaxID=56418 RepID=UPI0034D01031
MSSTQQYRDEKQNYNIAEVEVPTLQSGYYPDRYTRHGVPLFLDERRQRNRKIAKYIVMTILILSIAIVYIGFTVTFNKPVLGGSSSIIRSIFGPIGQRKQTSRPQNTIRHPVRVSTAHSCPIAKSPLSCHFPSANLDDIDTCCVNSPGGQLLLAQFWDFAPAVGPNDKWTLHGLWPDNCDGSFEQFCDHTRVVDSIETVFQTAGTTELLTAMRDSWLSNSGHNDGLWTHEWNKHGTCISTLHPKCYGSDDSAISPIVEYFSQAVDLHSTLDTFSALASAGITPAWDVQYNKTDILSAISDAITDGHNVTIGCNHSGVLSEIWYHFNVQGRAQDGEYVFADPDGIKDSCPETGIKYFPKVPRRHHDVPLPSDPSTEPFTGKGYVIVNDGTQGCVISGGEWYSSGTCATIRGHVSEFGGVELRSSRGPCGVSAQGKFVCGREIEPSQFTVGAEGELLYSGIGIWGAYQAASGWLKEGLWNFKFIEKLELPVEVRLYWRAL